MHLLPDDLRHTLWLWVAGGVRPGDFLSAVIANDLRGACEHADSRSRHLLFEIVSYLYNECPRDCWGSPEALLTWPKEVLRLRDRTQA